MRCRRVAELAEPAVDVEGTDRPDQDNPKEEALTLTHDLMANSDLTGDDYGSTQIIEISDEAGKVLQEVLSGSVSRDQAKQK